MEVSKETLYRIAEECPRAMWSYIILQDLEPAINTEIIVRRAQIVKERLLSWAKFCHGLKVLHLNRIIKIKRRETDFVVVSRKE